MHLRDRYGQIYYRAFIFYIGTLIIMKGPRWLADEWLLAGKQTEKSDIFLSGYLIDFLKRHEGKFIMPAITFEDPRSYVFMANIPFMTDCRQKNVFQFADSLPVFTRKVRYIDIGCGDGDFTLKLLSHLVNSGKIPGYSEILLIDPSSAMVRLASEKISSVFPDAVIKSVHTKIQEFTSGIDHRYDIALSSLSFHHMPIEEKRTHLSAIKPWIDHFLLFELDADHDSPERYSPELALSTYQAYGRVIDLVCSYDAPSEVITNCVECFWMSELISIMSEPRGERSDYHMLRYQWIDLCRTVFGDEFSLMSESTAFADKYFSLFTLHFGRVHSG